MTQAIFKFGYNVLINLVTWFFGYLATNHHSPLYRLFGIKMRLFIDGQKTSKKAIKQTFANKQGRVDYWFHCASLGEFGIARPIMNKLHDEGRSIVLTFFSSTGVEALANKSVAYTGADHIYYLPLDTKRNVRSFLDALAPKKAVFIKSEFWMNYLNELYRRDIPTYLVSAYFTEKSVLNKWYGGVFRNLLKTFSRIYTQDFESVTRLDTIGYHDAIVTGDALYDNAVANSLSPYENDIVKRFCNTAKQGVLVAGSIDTKHDLLLVAQVVNNHPDRKFIVVPHEVDKKHMQQVTAALSVKTMCYADCNASTDFSEVNVLVIDYVGELAKLYRYGQLAYVGGGFTSLLHSVVEPAVYGLPVAFGPRIDRKAAPQLMIQSGFGAMVRNARELDTWYCQMMADEERRLQLSAVAKELILSSAGKTAIIVRELE
ncbi:MAG: 3-deoxy-D-manno-octulosonic acid transferase [Bacteroidales bacterium]|nr:3-deoxy-D-manno-octulosonic acid transferase [Candidatus Physcousia equi]